MSKLSKNRGFSLIELVAVIVILGVLATATTQYIIFGTEIYIQSSERQKVLTQSRFLVERLTREIRTAIPNSIRVSSNNACLELVPIKASGAYREDALVGAPPINPNVSTGQLDVISWDRNTFENGDRIYIYATDISDIYDSTNDLNDNFAILNTLSGTSPEYSIDLVQVFGQEDVFADASPITRFFTADHSVNFCFISNGTNYDVYRFESTNFSPGQTVPVNANGILMAEGLTNTLATEPPFEYLDIAQTKNSVVNLYLEFEANQSENMFFNHEVHIPNVP